MRAVLVVALAGALCASADEPWLVDVCNGCSVEWTCPPGQKSECQPVPWSESEWCPAGMTQMVCVEGDPPPPPSETADAPVGFVVTHVVYSVPGRSSSMAYSAGDVVGATTTLADSWKDTLQAKAAVGANVIVATGNIEVTVTDIWENTNTSTRDISVELVTGYRKPGYTESINHDDDEVWFLASPRIQLTHTPASIYGPEALEWQLLFDGFTQPYFMYVGELNGHYAIEPGVWTFLTQHGIDATDFPQLLKADPLAAGALPNQALDAARYEYLGTFPYIPLPNATAQASLQTYTVTRKLTSTQESKADSSYETGLKYGATFSFVAHSSWSVENKFQVRNVSTARSSTSQSRSASLTVGQPPFGYAGPTVLRVYMDRIWRTYMFQLDWY